MLSGFCPDRDRLAWSAPPQGPRLMISVLIYRSLSSLLKAIGA